MKIKRIGEFITESVQTECLHTEIFDRAKSENAKINSVVDELPPVSELSNGCYVGYQYAQVLELANGKIYKTEIGLLRSRELTNRELFKVENGKITDSSEQNEKLTPPSISELENGVYTAKFYSWMFELENGMVYKTNVGIRRGRNQTEFKEYEILDGKIVNPV